MKISNDFFFLPKSSKCISRNDFEGHPRTTSDPFSILKVQYPQPYLPSQGLSLSSLEAVSMHCLFAEIFLYLLEDLLL